MADNRPPTSNEASAAAPPAGGPVGPPSEQQLSELAAAITAAGTEVRELKSAGSDFSAALAVLKAKKAEYRNLTGIDYKPPKSKAEADEFELHTQIIAATNQLNKLKIDGNDTAAAEADLAALKEKYKTLAGKDFVLSDGKKKKKKKKLSLIHI